MPSVSQSQRGLIFAKRAKYGSVDKAPKKWKWCFEEGWENKGKLPKKVKKKKKKNESVIMTFTDMINESNSKYSPVFLEKFTNFSDLSDWIGRLPEQERNWVGEQFDKKYTD